MTHARLVALRVLRPAALLITVAGLVACSATPAPTGSPSSTVSQPSPTATQSEPTVRFDVGCDDAVPASTVQSALGVGVIPITRWPDVSVAGGVIESFNTAMHVAMVQAGSLICTWGTDDTAAFSVVAVPDAAQEFQALVPTFYGLPAVASSFGVAYGFCGTAGEPECSHQVLIGSTWLSVAQSGVRLTDAQLATLVDSASAAIAEATIAPAWIAPVRMLSPQTNCSTLADAVVGATAEPLAPSGYAQYLEAASVDVADGLGCLIAMPTGSAQVVVIPGGAWSWAEWAPASNASLTLEPVAGLGEAAAVGCAGTTCTVHVISGGDRVAISGQFDSRESAVSFASALLAALS